MAIFKCKMCGGALEISGNQSVGVCEYCGTKQTFPRLDDDRKANLYDRANHFRRNNEFDKAMSIYESILNEDNTDAESYWSIVLCRYGIEYVEDPVSRKRIPTVNRAQFTSVLMDEDYKSAINYADAVQKEVYEAEARAIDNIQKGILEISRKEEPFDVFICYKESDANGRRTPDSVLANDLYHELTKEGFKVFFARITLEDKLGSAYEPYIFAALNSSKVMVVLGTKPEYFSAVWVRNEWSRYLALIKGGANKVLIPAYKDMDPYDLPDEFSHLQAQDMTKLGFMQDLVRGIRKIAGDTQPAVAPPTVIGGAAASVDSLLRRAFMFIEDADWSNANDYCEKVLDIEPENAQAYFAKFMVETKLSTFEQVAAYNKIVDSKNFQKAFRYADDSFKETLQGYLNAINNNIANAYNQGLSLKNSGDFINARQIFLSIPAYRDCVAQAEECAALQHEKETEETYNNACDMMKFDKIDVLTEAKNMFMSICDYKDSRAKADACDIKIRNISAKLQRIEKINTEIAMKNTAINMGRGRSIKRAILRGIFLSFMPIGGLYAMGGGFETGGEAALIGFLGGLVLIGIYALIIYGSFSAIRKRRKEIRKLTEELESLQ